MERVSRNFVLKDKTRIDRVLNRAMHKTIRILAASAAIALFSTPSYAEGALKQNFKQADINTVIESVAKITNRNFIIDPRVKGKVTFIAPQGMNPDSLYDSFLAVLNVYGFAAIEGEDGLVKIVPANLARDQLPYRGFDANGEEWVTEVINVNHVNASKLVAVLRPLVAKEGHLVAQNESNKLIVSDTVSNIKRIKKILKRVDVNVSGAYEVISVTHTSVSELAKTLKSVMPKAQGGASVTVGFDERTNRLILTGDENKRMMLRMLVAELDQPIDAEGGAQVIYLRYAKAADMVKVLQKIAGNRLFQVSADSGSENDGSATASSEKSGKKSKGLATSALDKKELDNQISIEADERMNALIISAPTPVLNGLKRVIKQLDIRRAQVLIEAIFVEVSAEKSAQLGVDWVLNTSNGVGLVNFSGVLPSLAAAASSTTAAASLDLGLGTSVVAGEVDSQSRGWGALIRAFNSDTDSNILATPSVLTLDNEEAEILVGREVPFQTGSYTSTNSSVSNPFSTIQRETVGLKLKVLPQINEGNEVYLEIDQEVSDVLPRGEAVDLQTKKRQIKTKVIVGDGDMVVLGGLIDEKETMTSSKVPGLGDLPIFGSFFSSDSNSRERSNLMVFIRPVIIRSKEMSDYYSNQKYSYVYKEQDALLNKEDQGLLGEQLRPQMPTAQQWLNHKADDQPPQLKQLESNKQGDAQQAKQPGENELTVTVHTVTIEELLGL